MHIYINGINRNNFYKLTVCRDKNVKLTVYHCNGIHSVLHRISDIIYWKNVSYFLTGIITFYCVIKFAPKLQRKTINTFWRIKRILIQIKETIQSVDFMNFKGVSSNTFLSSPHLCFIIVFIHDLFVSRDGPVMIHWWVRKPPREPNN